MRWAKRTQWDAEESGFAAMAAAAAAEGRAVDLTASNPTVCGFEYPAEIAAALADAAAARYEPDALGMVTARRAVCDYYAGLGQASADVPGEEAAAGDTAVACATAVAAEDVCLTASTSEGYSFLFRLLCDAGDEVLVASPSYPLFSLLAGLEGVRLVEYPLLFHDGWSIDLAGLERLVTARTRAVVVVHPNNPTGQYAARERAALEALCARQGCALIVDEVFLEYALGGARPVSFASGGAGEDAPLTFVLSGVSKVCGLPQMKCSWMVCRGPRMLQREAMRRLEIIADTFLSVAGPVQHALPRWIAARHSLQRQITSRSAENLRLLREHAGGFDADVLPVEGGWTAVLRVPRHVAGEPFAVWALQQGAVVQPGPFYGLGSGHVVVSLLTAPAAMRLGLERLRAS